MKYSDFRKILEDLRTEALEARAMAAKMAFEGPQEYNKQADVVYAMLTNMTVDLSDEIWRLEDAEDV